MTKKPAQPTKESKSNAAMRTWYTELIFGSVALGIVYLSLSLAIDTGSLLAYAVTVVFFGLGVHHYLRAARALRKGKPGDTGEQ